MVGITRASLIMNKACPVQQMRSYADMRRESDACSYLIEDREAFKHNLQWAQNILEGGAEHVKKMLISYHYDIERLMDENLEVRRKLEKLRSVMEQFENQMQSLYLQSETERRAARASASQLAAAQRQLESYRRLADMEASKKSQAERALCVEKKRANRLERRLRKLEQATQVSNTGSGLASAIEKLTRKSPAVGKRLAAACHPDKCPDECHQLAAELFRFVQSVRDTLGSSA